ncbi:DUF2145 domain-containing protein [Roseateles amylovorans]|uniref:DUF2145 domain-containing protein n=1 Tax=Roseateles amylovorans TaxID=2978473 RepID=A0ABY6AWE5_9BURK|nr:DUF2145 domain-containing protein [Roseateles amylovorans]UXH76920.1 DUF2145 domain-containing protein [Roseateles amylovorans]
MSLRADAAAASCIDEPRRRSTEGKRRQGRRALGLLVGVGLMLSGLNAGAAVFCDRPSDLNAIDQDRQLRLVAEVKRVLQQAGPAAALVSRSGTDLDRFNIRYSHAGLALRDSANGAWSVRQLYYACDESRPRLFDQGLTGFLMSAGKIEPTRLSMVLLPPEPAQRLATLALDNRRALALLAPQYSANAYAFSTRYQNCNQWVAELMASAWSGEPPDDRPAAQQRLSALGYEPEAVRIPSHSLMFAAQFVPLVHLDDHPIDDLYALRMRVSTPASLEAFAHRLAPEAERVELCATADRLVVRRGWQPLDASCMPGAMDQIIALRD